MTGFWGSGAELVPERRDGSAGFRVLRPFSFVRERNPSLGWPGWVALDALLVETDWVAEGDVSTLTLRNAADDPMLEEPVTLRGVVRKVSGEQPVRCCGMGPPSGLWGPLTKLGEGDPRAEHRWPELGAPPYANNLLPLLLQLQ